MTIAVVAPPAPGVYIAQRQLSSITRLIFVANHCKFLCVCSFDPQAC
jgi:hypothetical protein